MSECLHCEINELVKERIEQGAVDVAELASMIVESLAELILIAPEDKQSKLMAEVFAHFGQVILEKSSAIEGGASSATH